MVNDYIQPRTNFRDSGHPEVPELLKVQEVTVQGNVMCTR